MLAQPRSAAHASRLPAPGTPRDRGPAGRTRGSAPPPTVSAGPGPGEPAPCSPPARDSSSPRLLAQPRRPARARGAGGVRGLWLLSFGFGPSGPLILTNPFSPHPDRHRAGGPGAHRRTNGGSPSAASQLHPQQPQPWSIRARRSSHSPCGTRRGTRRLMKVKGLLLLMAEFCPTLLSTCAAASSVPWGERSCEHHPRGRCRDPHHHPMQGLPQLPRGQQWSPAQPHLSALQPPTYLPGSSPSG